MNNNWEIFSHKLHYFQGVCENGNEGMVDGFRNILKDMRKWLKDNPCEPIELNVRWVYDQFDKQYKIAGKIERVELS